MTVEYYIVLHFVLSKKTGKLDYELHTTYEMEFVSDVPNDDNY